MVGGLTPEGEDGTNPLTFLILESYRRNKMTNPLTTLRLHRDSPEALVRYACEVLKDGGGMPALFNDEQLIPALERLGIPTPDARDYTNDGCWEVIIPGRTDFRFQRLSMMLCLEWALNRGRLPPRRRLRRARYGRPARFCHLGSALAGYARADGRHGRPPGAARGGDPRRPLHHRPGAAAQRADRGLHRRNGAT